MEEFRLDNQRLDEENRELRAEIHRLEALQKSSRDAQAELDALREHVRKIDRVDESKGNVAFSTNDKWNNCVKNMHEN